MIALVFRASGGRRLLMGAAQAVNPNLKMLSPEDRAGVRLLDGTALSNLGSPGDDRLMDPAGLAEDPPVRTPLTLAEFDAAYPAAGRWAPPE